MTLNESDASALKAAVRSFWDEASCGETYAVGQSDAERWEAQSRTRYELEPFISRFARFADAENASVLEIGVGMGADHFHFAGAQPNCLVGIDLTPRAARITSARLRNKGLPARVNVADTERLPFKDDSFNVVYSWGIIHHSPETPRAIDEIWRVPRHGDCARVMIYHKNSIVSLLLWIRYAPLRFRPTPSLDHIYAQHLESPGTKAYTLEEAKRLFKHLPM